MYTNTGIVLGHTYQLCNIAIKNQEVFYWENINHRNVLQDMRHHLVLEDLINKFTSMT